MKFPRLTAVLVIPVMAMTLAACGSSNSSTTGTSSSATTNSQSEAPASVQLSVKKRTIGVVDISREAPIENRMDEALEAGGKELGWDVKITNAAGSPTKAIAAIEAFANEHVEGLITESIGLEGAQRAVQEFQSAKTPLIQIGGELPPSPLFDAEYVENEHQFGEVLAKKIVEDHPNGAKVGNVELSTNPATKTRGEALKQVLKAAGSKFSIPTSYEFDLANPVVSTQEGVTNMLTAQPDLNVIWGVSDITVQPAISAIDRKQSDAQVYSFYSDPSNIEALRKKTPLAAVADANLQEASLVSLDQLLGHFEKGATINRKALTSEALDYKIVDRENLPPVGQQVYPLKTTMQPFVEKWAKEYPAK